MKTCKNLFITITILTAVLFFAQPCFSSCNTASMPRGQGDLGNNPEAMQPGSNGNNPCGSPAWSVNMVNLNLFVLDIPLWYTPSIGPSVNISLSYNSQAQTDDNQPFGKKWQFGYGTGLTVLPDNNVLVLMPDGRQDLFVNDGSGGYTRPYKVYNRLVRIGAGHYELIFPDGSAYVYQTPSGVTRPILTKIRDAYGQSLTLSYNGSGELITITDASGQTTTLSYTSGKVTMVTDPFGRTALFEYDGDQNLQKITDMGGYWTSFGYDGNSYLTQMEDGRGRTTFHIEPSDTATTALPYPAPGAEMWQNYRITVTDPMAGKQEFFYSGNLGYGWHVAPENYRDYVSSTQNNASDTVPKTKYYYENTTKGIREEIKTIITPEGNTTAYTYDTQTGLHTGVTDSSGNTVTLTYNDMGRITHIQDAKDVETDLIYDANLVDLLEIKTFKGADTFYHQTMIYNAFHDATSISDVVSDRITRIAYNPYGQVTTVTDPLSIDTSFIYNDDHQPVEVLRDGKTIESYTYDTRGRIRSQTDSADMTLTFDYNDLNHVTAIAYPDGKTIMRTYSSCCPRLVDSTTDRSGRTVNYVYDNLKRLTDVFDQGHTQYRYDLNGNITRLIDANKNQTDFDYDNDNRLIRKTYADSTSILFRYNNNGLLISRINARNIETNYAYDENYNLVRISYSDTTPEVVYTYDAFNRVTGVKDVTGTQALDYYPDHLLKSVDGPFNHDTITYTYDDLGRRTGMIPETGQAVSYIYDRLSRLTTIQTNAGDFAYAYSSDKSPMVKTLTHPNGVSAVYTYDPLLNRLTAISNQTSAAQIISRHEYTYTNDRIKSETITNAEPITGFQEALVRYDNNAVNQLLKTSPPEKLFTYDSDGNMTQGYTPEGYIFNAAYDAENRLQKIEYSDNSISRKIEYTYDARSFLARIKTYENNSLISDIHIIRDGLLSLQERNTDGIVLREYTWGLNMGGGIGGLLNLNQNGQNYAYHYDGRGNVTGVTDTAQSPAAAYRYDAFGALMKKSGTLDQPFAFSTKRYNEATGLGYYGYRFYAPLLGRWINQDPLGEQGGLNLYGFVLNDPVNYLDPFGFSGISLPITKSLTAEQRNSLHEELNKSLDVIIFKKFVRKQFPVLDWIAKGSDFINVFSKCSDSDLTTNEKMFLFLSKIPGKTIIPAEPIIKGYIELKNEVYTKSKIDSYFPTSLRDAPF